MKAAVTHDNGRSEVVDRAIPEVSEEGLVRIRLVATGICGTDRHIVHGDYPADLPRVLGHEIVGRVDSLPNGSNLGLAVGVPVVVDPNIPCHACVYCRVGKVHLCTRRRAIGIDWDGGFQEYAVVPSSQVYRLNEDIPIEVGVLAEPLSCCIHGLDQLQTAPNDHVAIVGMGSIGVMMARLLQMYGIRDVTAFEVNENRRAAARDMGINTAEWDPARAEADYAERFDAVIDAVGSGRVVQWAETALRRSGRILVFGVAHPEDQAAIHPYTLYAKELTIMSANTNPFTMSRAVSVVNTQYRDLLPLLTDPVGLDGIPEALERPPKGFKTFLTLEEGR